MSTATEIRTVVASSTHACGGVTLTRVEKGNDVSWCLHYRDGGISGMSLYETPTAAWNAYGLKARKNGSMA